MKKEGLWLGGGVAVVLAAVLAWWNTNHPPDAPVGLPRDVQEEPHFAAAGEGSKEGREGRRVAPARPAIAPRSTLLGDTVTVLEGSVTARGSDQPVKFRTRNGMTISAALLVKNGDGSIRLTAPLQIESTTGATITIQSGCATIAPDGSFKTEGETTMAAGAKTP